MKISELMTALTIVFKEDGDINVFCYGDSNPAYPHPDKRYDGGLVVAECVTTTRNEYGEKYAYISEKELDPDEWHELMEKR